MMLVAVETESENWNFLMYGRIGKHPMQSLYSDSVNLQTFPGRKRSGCMHVSPTGLIYHFQMSAVTVSAVNGVAIEGTLSSVSAMSTLYVPNPGIYLHIKISVESHIFVSDVNLHH